MDENAGRRLRAWLEAGPPSQADIAREAGVSRQFVWRVLDGRVKPSARIVEACRRLGLPVSAIFGEDSS